MGKHERMTVPVIVRDDTFKGSWCVLHAGEGERFQTIMCASEELADTYLREFERNGHLTIYNPLSNMSDIIEPALVLKAKASDAVVKTYRSIDIPADYINITVKI